MSFKDDLTTDLNIFFNLDEFAEEVVYLAQGEQDSITINAVIEYLDDLELNTSGNHHKAIAFVKKSDINSPQNMDRIWIDSVEWKVEKIEQEDNQVAKLHIRRNESISI